MKWKFWGNERVTEPEGVDVLPPPGPLHRLLLRHLVNELELEPEWVRTLYGVTRPVAGQENVHAFRAFSPSKTASLGLTVRDYSTLDEYTQLILFSGTFNTEAGTVNLMPEIRRRVA